MDDKIIAIYCLLDDFLKAQHHREDKRARMSDAEVMTTALVAALFFGGRLERARALLCAPQYIPSMLSKSRLNRRLHALIPHFEAFFYALAEHAKERLPESEPPTFVLDTYPVPCCALIRYKRCRLFPASHLNERGKPAYRGYCASKRTYFYGLKLHLVVTATGIPVEFGLSPGAMSDLHGWRTLALNLGSGAELLVDKGYTDYVCEDALLFGDGIRLRPLRRKDAKRREPAWEHYLNSVRRKIIETTLSRLTGLLPRWIHAVTGQGFALKVLWFVTAVALDMMLP